MLFLIEYDRQRGQLLKLTRFESSDASEAAQARLHRELELARAGLVLEVVLLEAESETDLHLTHRRYFKTVTELTRWE